MPPSAAVGAERLMEAFARCGLPGFALGLGLGLGLAIVQQIVTRLQCQLLSERSPPIGHSVQVVVPLSRDTGAGDCFEADNSGERMSLKGRELPAAPKT